MKVRTLGDLAVAINRIGNGYLALTEKSWTSTDTKIAGTRFRRQGKGRRGTKIIVKDPNGVEVMKYDTSETTPVQVAIETAIKFFGAALDLDPGELFAVGEYVRVIDFGPLYGTIVKVKMRDKTRAKSYEVKLRNGHVKTTEPWRIRRG